MRRHDRVHGAGDSVCERPFQRFLAPREYRYHACPMELTRTSLIACRDAVASGQISAVSLARAYLDRITGHDGVLGCYGQVFADRALARAAQVDAGEVVGALAGVPIAIKDILCTDWGRTTCSSKMLAGFEAPYNATAVNRLEAAGAIILGKTNMDEFAMGSSTETCAWGPTRNPWDTACVPGGSSGGSAAAVAADLCAAALGTDTGGSIRQPAALCGVVGLKPTYGRVSRWGLVAFASSLDQIGPITHTVEDAALLLGVISGPDERDATCSDRPVPDYLAALNNPPAALRIGLATQYLSEVNDPAVQAAVDEAITLFRDHGATIEEVDLPHTEYGIPTYYIVATAEASSNLARYDGVHYGHRAESSDGLVDLYSRSRAEGFGDEVKRRIMLGTYALSSGYYDAYYLRALKVRRLIQEDFNRVFSGDGACDLILCPTTTGPAFPIGSRIDNPLDMYLNDIYTVNANLSGIPGITLPAGTTTAGGSRHRPVGIQLLAPLFEESKLLQAAHLYQQHTAHHVSRPDLVAS